MPQGWAIVAIWHRPNGFWLKVERWMPSGAPSTRKQYCFFYAFKLALLHIKACLCPLAYKRLISEALKDTYELSYFLHKINMNQLLFNTRPFQYWDYTKKILTKLTRWCLNLFLFCQKTSNLEHMKGYKTNKKYHQQTNFGHVIWYGSFRFR